MRQMQDFSNGSLKILMNAKICHRIDNKLAEFSYKVLYNVLICGQILSKWTNSSKYALCVNRCTTYRTCYIIAN